jgi:molybdate/tungstate transport system substrate-binding protein
MWSCGDSSEKSGASENEIIIFSAGSLAIPFKEMAKHYQSSHPETSIKFEFSGSRTAARKVSDLKKKCDIIASADYTVIDELLIPEYAAWNIHFASNEMAIAYTSKSKYADDINTHNWYSILNKKEVHFGRSDPDSDPCGYRTVLSMKLAEKYYQKTGLANELLAKDKEYIRPKETDLLSLLESETIDYVFIYRSIIKQHKLRLLVLPDSINLKLSSLAPYYQTVDISISGKKPGETIIKKGEPMIYGVTMIKDAPHPDKALDFLQFMLGEKGRIIIDHKGQTPLIPSATASFDNVPDILKPFARPL